MVNRSAETWRLIIDPPLAGALNMAVDEALLYSIGAGQALPTLRLYAWQPTCLSLGYAQPGADVDQARLQEHGWQVVRRLTGGRAILHTDQRSELTYSLTLPKEHGLAAGSILDSYRRLSAALLQAVQSIGLAANADQQLDGAAKLQGPVCFEVPSNYEITAGGKKLIGSAQVRKHAALLQHGSLPLDGSLGQICEALHFADEATRRLAQDRVLTRATTLSAALGRPIDWQAAADALINAAEACFDVRLERDGLNQAERAQADQLCAQRYRSDAWTFRT